jgi:hypothetical protein
MTLLENGELKKQFGPNNTKVNRSWKKLHEEGNYNL